MLNKSFDVREYHYAPGLKGKVHIENVCGTRDSEGYARMTVVEIPGDELLAVVKDAAPQPMVGVSLLVVWNDHILLSRRKGSHGAGEYGTPGGHMENGETPAACAYRELSEECGVTFQVSMPRPLCVTNLTEYLPKHYLDIGMVAHRLDGEPENMEPEKCGGWEWHPLNRLPDGRFGAVDNLVIAYQNGQQFFI